MIGTEMMLLGEDPPLADIGHAPHVRNDIGKFNEQWVVLYRNRTGAETLADFRRVTGRRLDALRALPAAKWDEEGFTPEGPGPYRQFMAIRVFDCWYHDQDIREALDRPGFLEGPVADLSLGRIPTKGLPYVVGKKAGGAAGRDRRVRRSPASRRSIAAVGVDGRAALLADAPAGPDDPRSRWIAGRSPDWPAGAGPARPPAPPVRCAVDGDDALGAARSSTTSRSRSDPRSVSVGPAERPPLRVRTPPAPIRPSAASKRLRVAAGERAASPALAVGTGRPEPRPRLRPARRCGRDGAPV